MIVFEIIRKDGGERYGLELTEEDARAFIGTEAMPHYEIMARDLPVVFLLVNQPDSYEESVSTEAVYSTLVAALAAKQEYQERSRS